MLAQQGDHMLTTRHPQASFMRGFTLVEMAIAMAVFGLLMAAAMPSIGTWLDNARIRNVAESIQSGIQAARAEAIRRNQSISFFLVSSDDPAVLDATCKLANDSGSWVISVSDPSGHCGDEPSTTVAPMIVQTRAVNDAGGSVTVTALQADATTAATTITFNGFGRVTNSGSAISRVDITGVNTGAEYRHLRLALSPTGTVRMCDPRITDTKDPRKC